MVCNETYKNEKGKWLSPDQIQKNMNDLSINAEISKMPKGLKFRNINTLNVNNVKMGKIKKMPKCQNVKTQNKSKRETLKIPRLQNTQKIKMPKVKILKVVNRTP